MSSDAELAALIGRRGDERLLEAAPEELGRPPALPEDPRRGAVVGAGVGMTGVSLVSGLALLGFGLFLVFRGGGSGGLGVALLVAGAVLAGTHWGWVHVAELTGGRLEARWQRPAVAAREAWLEGLEPITRWTVSTVVEEDGSVAVERWRLAPVPVGSKHFTFERTLERRELFGSDAPGAEVAERAELLRREAAAWSRAERERYEAGLEAYEAAALEHEDERERRAAARAASQALSDAVNSNLREPPLVE